MLALGWNNNARGLVTENEHLFAATDDTTDGDRGWYDTEDTTEPTDSQHRFSKHWTKNAMILLREIYSTKDDDIGASAFNTALKAALELQFPTPIDKQEGMKNGSVLSALQQILEGYHRNKSLSNVMIKGPDGSAVVAAHVEVLSAHSEYCSALFSDYWCECAESRGECTTMSLDETAFFAQLPLVLHYFYTGTMDRILESATLGEVLVLAIELVATELVEELLPHIYDSLNKDNAMEYLVLADLHSLSMLKERCLSLSLRRLIDEDEYRERGLELSSEAKAALRTLRAAFSRSIELNGDIYGDVKELIYMLRDAHAEAEIIYKESKQRNDDELQECRARMAAIDGAVLLTRSAAFELASLRGFEERLLKVQRTLEEQRRQLDVSAEFNRGQLAALDRVLSHAGTLLEF